MTETESAQIFDQGYRRYEGERTGVAGAIKSLVWETIRQALGLRRAWWLKLIPIAMIALAYIPAIVFAGLAAILPTELQETFLPSYAGYYGNIVVPIVLFGSITSALILTEDRRTGMLGVYLASPLDRKTYLLGKAIATTAMLIVLTVGPLLFLLIAYTLQENGPGGVVDWGVTFLRITFAGLLFALVMAGPGLAIASTTDRWVVAAASNVALFIASPIIAGSLVDLGDLSPHFRLLSLSGLARELTYRIHDQPDGIWRELENPTWTLLLAAFVWIAGSVGVIWWNYRRLLVRR